MPKIILAPLLTLLIAINAFGQHEAQYTQYMFNRLAINPAYAGSQDALSITSLYRNQWAGLEGAPETMTFSAHTPLRNERLGTGLLLVNDAIGVHKQLTIATSFSYTIPISEKERFSFGLQAGLINQRSDFTEIGSGANFSNDPAFANNNIASIKPEFGVGFYYESEKFYAGISSPNLSNASSTNEIASSNQLFFLNTGYVFHLNPVIKFHPSFLVKMAQDSPVSFDINATVIFNDVLWTGISYRAESSFSAMAQVQLSPQLRFGYAYDAAPFRGFNQSVGGSHEIMLNYRFSFFRSKVVTPRYF